MKEFFVGGTVVVSSVIIIIYGLLGIITRIDMYGDIERYYAFKNTIEIARKNNPESIESAAILHEVAEWNKNIASAKYYNSFVVFDWCIPDECAELEPLN